MQQSLIKVYTNDIAESFIENQRDNTTRTHKSNHNRGRLSEQQREWILRIANLYKQSAESDQIYMPADSYRETDPY